MITETPKTAIRLDPPTNVIDGQSFTPTRKLSAAISNPNTNEPLLAQYATDDDALSQALKAADHVHKTGVWSTVANEDRARLLEQIADELDGFLEEIACVESLTTGVVISQSRKLARMIPLMFRQAAQCYRQMKSTAYAHAQVQRVAWGPAAVITSWSNGTIFAAHKVASALAAGAPVILKPSEWTPFSGDFLARAIAATELPPGVFQLVQGGADVGFKLVTDPRIKAISFCGSRSVGRNIAQACAGEFKPMQLALDGVNPLIVLEDADIDLATEHIVTALTALNGQWCRSMGRLLVHGKCYHALLQRVLDRLESLVIGDSLEPDSEMGPLMNIEQKQTIEAAITQMMWNGGVVHQASRLPDLPGNFIQPTLITNCQPQETAFEIFGPVAAVHLFKDDDEAVFLANQPEAGWAGYVFSADEDHARQIASRLQIAAVTINGVSLYGQHPNVPIAAWGYSGLGETGVAESIRFFGGTRAIDVAGS